MFLLTGRVIKEPELGDVGFCMIRTRSTREGGKNKTEKTYEIGMGV